MCRFIKMGSNYTQKRGVGVERKHTLAANLLTFTAHASVTFKRADSSRASRYCSMALAKVDWKESESNAHRAKASCYSFNVQIPSGSTETAVNRSIRANLFSRGHCLPVIVAVPPHSNAATLVNKQARFFVVVFFLVLSPLQFILSL